MSQCGFNSPDTGRCLASGRLEIVPVWSSEEFSRWAGDWDRLVRAADRPSPFFLHGWLRAWLDRYVSPEGLRAVIARRNGKLVGALPLVVEHCRGVRVARFPGPPGTSLGDIFLAPGEASELAFMIAEHGVQARLFEFADLLGYPAGGRLAAATGRIPLRQIERLEAPVLDLSSGWETVYRRQTSSKSRNLHRRRRRQLAGLGKLELTVSRTLAELEPALDEAFTLHELRWHGRPDRSEFATPRGREFNRAALRNLAQLGLPRIVTLRLDGRPIAFHYYLLLERRMYVYRLAFDPAYGRYSPGLITTLEAIEAAASEGAERVEFLGGGEEYKLALADRLEPLYHGFGLASSAKGQVAATIALAHAQARLALKRSRAVRRLYYEGLRPLRAGLRMVRGAGLLAVLTTEV